MTSEYHLFLLLPIIAAIFFLASASYFLYARWLRIEEEYGHPTTFSFLTANVGNAELTRIMDGFGLKYQDITVLRRNISAMMPDVAFMQEVKLRKHAEEIFDTGDYHIHHEGDVCTALKKTLFTPPEQLGAHPNADGFSACRTTVIPENAPLIFINVHTISPLKDSTFMKRSHQIRMIIDKTMEFSARGEKVVTGGDFNFDPWRFESMRNRLRIAENETELDKLKHFWFDNLTPGDSGIRMVSCNEKTWYFTASYTIDHVISNLPSSDFKVLDAPDEKLDIDHSLIMDHPREHFMDHRALTCMFEIQGAGRLIALKKWLTARRRTAGKD